MTDYEMFTNVIGTGIFSLPDILEKLKIVWIQGSLSDDQYKELADLARQKATPAGTLPDDLTQLNSRISELDSRVRILEEKAGITKPTGPQPYKQPKSAADAYNKGMQCIWKGKIEESTQDGNVWDPDTYPQGWKEVKND